MLLSAGTIAGMRRQLGLIALLWLGFVLRVLRLDLRALWWDEGLSLYFSRFGYIENAARTVQVADTNPPIYRLILGQWTALAGSSAWSTRFFSVLLAVLLLAVVYQLARSLRLGQRAALWASGLAAASPMLIYYAQEAKGYSQVALAGGLLMLSWVRLHRPLWDDDALPGPVWLWAVWTLALVLGMGGHYIFAFLVVTLNLASLVLLVRLWPWDGTRWRHAALLYGTQALGALALLPYVYLTYVGTSAVVRNETGEFIGLGTPWDFTVIHALELVSGPRAAWWPGGLAVLGVGLLAGYAVWGMRRHRELRVPLALMLAVIVLPFVMGLALHSVHPFFFPRFLLYSVPVLLMLAGWAVAKQRALLLALVLVAAGWLPTLTGFYQQWDDPDEDWRPVADTLAPLVREGDAGLFVFGWVPGYLHAYLPPAPEPDYVIGHFEPDNTASQLEPLIAEYDRIWMLDYEVDAFDPRNPGGNWLGDRYALAYAGWVHTAHLSLFVAPPGVPLTEAAQFATGLNVRYNAPPASLQPGDSIGLMFRWENGGAGLPHLAGFLHLRDATGQVVAQRDSLPVNGRRSFADLAPGETLDDPRGLVVPPDLPPGDYTLVFGLYDPATGERALLRDGRDELALGRLTVQP